jgi:hypothetical protein
VRGIDGLKITRVWGDEKETPGSEKDSYRVAAPRLRGTAGAGGEHRAAGRGRVLSPCFFHPNQAPTTLPPERLPWTLMRQISRRSWSWPCACSDTARTPPRSLPPTIAGHGKPGPIGPARPGPKMARPVGPKHAVGPGLGRIFWPNKSNGPGLGRKK